MNDDFASIMAKFLVGIVLFVLAVVVDGFVLTYLWGWFLVPLGLVQIGMAHAIGVSILVSYLTHQTNNSDDNDDASKTFWTMIITSFCKSGLVMLMGYVAHSFM